MAFLDSFCPAFFGYKAQKNKSQIEDNFLKSGMLAIWPTIWLAFGWLALCSVN
jgi:hypothetical protein